MLKGGYVRIVACYHSFACMLHFDLVFSTFWLFNPYILQHFSDNVFTLYMYV